MSCLTIFEISGAHVNDHECHKIRHKNKQKKKKFFFYILFRSRLFIYFLPYLDKLNDIRRFSAKYKYIYIFLGGIVSKGWERQFFYIRSNI